MRRKVIVCNTKQWVNNSCWPMLYHVILCSFGIGDIQQTATSMRIFERKMMMMKTKAKTLSFVFALNIDKFFGPRPTEHWMFQKWCHVSCRFQFLLDLSLSLVIELKCLAFCHFTWATHERSWDTYFLRFVELRQMRAEGMVACSYFNQFVWILSMIKKKREKMMVRNKTTALRPNVIPHFMPILQHHI